MHILKLTIIALGLSLSVVGIAWADGSADTSGDINVALPEPGTLVLLLTGIGTGAAVFLRRRK